MIIMTNQMFFVIVLDYSDFVLVNGKCSTAFLLKGKRDFPPSLSQVQIVMVN